MKNVLLMTGASQIGTAILRRVGSNMKIVIGDKNLDSANQVVKTLTDAGFDVELVALDISKRDEIIKVIKHAQTFGPITKFINGAGVSPSQASIETILKVDLYGTAILLEEVGKAIAPGGSGITISSLAGYRLKNITPTEDEALATTNVEELLKLPLLDVEKVGNTMNAYAYAKRCNIKRVMAEALIWGEKKGQGLIQSLPA